MWLVVLLCVVASQYVERRGLRADSHSVCGSEATAERIHIYSSCVYRALSCAVHVGLPTAYFNGIRRRASVLYKASQRRRAVCKRSEEVTY